MTIVNNEYFYSQKRWNYLPSNLLTIQKLKQRVIEKQRRRSSGVARSQTILGHVP